MPKLSTIIALSLSMSLLTANLRSQDESDYSTFPEESVAYEECCYAAHWSAYVPIVGLVIAGACMGFADNCHKSSSSHSGHLPLGSIGNPSDSGSTGYSH